MQVGLHSVISGQDLQYGVSTARKKPFLLQKMGRQECTVMIAFILSIAFVMDAHAAQASLAAPRAPINIVRDVIKTIKEGEALVPGVVGRFVSVVLLHPLDSLKTRVHTISTATRRTAEVAAFRGGSPFQGVVPSVLGHVPNGLFTCIGYEVWREILRDNAPDLPFRAKVLISAVMGDLTGHLWLTPMEVLKVQLQAGRHQSFGAAFAAAARAGPGAFYQGYLAHISRDLPFRALQVPVMLEEAMKKDRGARRDHGRPPYSLSCIMMLSRVS